LENLSAVLFKRPYVILNILKPLYIPQCHRYAT